MCNLHSPVKRNTSCIFCLYLDVGVLGKWFDNTAGCSKFAANESTPMPAILGMHPLLFLLGHNTYIQFSQQPANLELKWLK